MADKREAKDNGLFMEVRIMRTEILIRDINEIEDVMEQTANIPGHRYVYAMSVVIWHMLQWMVRHADK